MTFAQEAGVCIQCKNPKSATGHFLDLFKSFLCLNFTKVSQDMMRWPSDKMSTCDELRLEQVPSLRPEDRHVNLSAAVLIETQLQSYKRQNLALV